MYKYIYNIYEYQSLKRYKQVQKSTRWELDILSKVQDVQVNLSQPWSLGIQHSTFNVQCPFNSFCLPFNDSY